MSNNELYKFGEFALCSEDKTLSRAGENIALTPKMYDLLLVLVANADRVLEKEYLLRTVWPDSFVEEGNITYNIRQLRKALGDDAQQPMFIETVPRRGYRFISKVEEISSETLASDGDADIARVYAAENAAGNARYLDRRVVFSLGVFVLIAAVAALVTWFARGRVVSAAPILGTPFSAEKFSTDGQVYHAVISPDGKNLIYTHRNGGKQSLWLRQIETSNNVQIQPPSDGFYYGLAVSPDGNFIYFVRGQSPLQGRESDIYRMPVVGGVPQKLVSETEGWISVSGDGQELSFVRCPHTDDEYCSLWIANTADGKNERKLLSRPRPTRIGDNKISADGKTVVIAVGQSRTASNDFELVAVDIATGQERPLTAEKFFNINYIAWLPNGDGWLVTARRASDKNYRIWHISPSGDASMLTADSESYNRLSLDSSGSLLVSTRIDPDFHLYVYPLGTWNATPNILSNASTVSFGPDGKLVFSSFMTGDQEIWSINADGSDQRQLTNDRADEIAPVVSPDKSAIFFESNRSGAINIWRMNIDGTDQRQVTSSEGGFPLVVSPDGQWLYYRSGLRSTLRRVSLNGGNEEVVFDPQGQQFAVSPDCATLLLVKAGNGGTTFSTQALAGGKESRSYASADPSFELAAVTWAVDSKSFIYTLTADDSQDRNVWSQPLTGEAPHAIAKLRSGELYELSGFAMSPNGKTLAAVQGTWNHDAVLIRGLK